MPDLPHGHARSTRGLEGMQNGSSSTTWPILDPMGGLEGM